MILALIFLFIGLYIIEPIYCAYAMVGISSLFILATIIVKVFGDEE